MVSRAIQIADGRAPSTARWTSDVAEIRGHFQGEMTARKRLVIHATGRVSGKIRYGKMLVQEGGEMSGDVGTISETAPMALGCSKDLRRAFRILPLGEAEAKGSTITSAGPLVGRERTRGELDQRSGRGLRARLELHEGDDLLVALRLPGRPRRTGSRPGCAFSTALPPREDVEAGADDELLQASLDEEGAAASRRAMSPVASHPPGRITSAVACGLR
jgi:hypothetical protein